MPSFEKHKQLIAMLFGENVAERYAWVHRYKDEPSKWLGVKHRVKRHGFLFDIMLGVLARDPMVAIVGILHDIQDFISTDLKRNLKKRRRRKSKSGVETW